MPREPPATNATWPDAYVIDLESFVQIRPYGGRLLAKNRTL